MNWTQEQALQGVWRSGNRQNKGLKELKWKLKAISLQCVERRWCILHKFVIICNPIFIEITQIDIFFSPMRWVTKALPLLLVWPLCQILKPNVAQEPKNLPTPDLKLSVSIKTFLFFSLIFLHGFSQFVWVWWRSNHILCQNCAEM